jgi:hypothetical protein
MSIHALRRAAPVLALPFALALALILARPAYAQDEPPAAPFTATVVVENDAGVAARTITFTQPISGLAALQATDFDVTLAETSFGPAVCAIAETGCPADNCFCNTERFWNYAFWNGDAWEGYAVGAADTRIETGGALELWRWGTFTGTVTADPAAVQAALGALDWLQGQQSRRDGGYGTMGASAETMFAIGANGIAARDWRIAGGLADLQRYARTNQTKFSRTDVAAAGKVAVALAAADACWTARAKTPADYYDEAAGAYAPDSGFNAWGILGTVALSETVPAAAVDALRAGILPEGGWEWQAGFGADSNTTALAIQALIAAGEPVTATEVVSGLAFLRSVQQPDGGFAYDASGQSGSDANSTAYAIMALRAVGEDPAGDAWRADDSGATPLDFLLSLRQPDGSFAWQPGMEPNAFATQQAIPALLGRSLPIAVKPAERCSWR